MRVSACKGCGAELVWARDPYGKPIPLETRSVVYQVTLDERGGYTCVRSRPTETERGRHTVVAMSNHFLHCPRADVFSKQDAKGERTAFDAPAITPTEPQQQDLLDQAFGTKP